MTTLIMYFNMKKRLKTTAETTNFIIWIISQNVIWHVRILYEITNLNFKNF